MVKTRANTSYEAIAKATTSERKKVTGALLQGIACASNEATPQCMKHEAEAKRLRQQFWQNIAPRWKKLKQRAKEAGKRLPDHVQWCEERAHAGRETYLEGLVVTPIARDQVDRTAAKRNGDVKKYTSCSAIRVCP